MSTNQHRAPWDCVFSKDEGDDCLPGERPATDREYFEIMCLCILQAGLNWGSIRKQWPRYRGGFLGFDHERLAETDPGELLERPDVVRNARKVEAIVHNAREVLAVAREHGSFGAYMDALGALPEAERVRALSARFKQVGPAAADYFLHAVGA